LDPPKKYYLLFRDQLEQLYMDEQQTIDESLKSSYVIDLESTIKINERLFRQKSSFFYNALVFALLAVVPYIACMGYHLSARSDGVEKTAAVKEKNLNFK
jgi:hypothetical protein